MKVLRHYTFSGSGVNRLCKTPRFRVNLKPELINPHLNLRGSPLPLLFAPSWQPAGPGLRTFAKHSPAPWPLSCGSRTEARPWALIVGRLLFRAYRATGSRLGPPKGTARDTYCLVATCQAHRLAPRPVRRIRPKRTAKYCRSEAPNAA